MSLPERLAAAKTQLDNLKQRIRQMQRAKEDEINWESHGRATSVLFAFQTRRNLLGHYGKVYALDWSKEPNVVLSASQDGKLIIWNAFTMNKKAAISLKSNWVMTCAFEKDDNRFVACGGLDNICSIYEASTGGVGGSNMAMPNELIGHDGYLSSCEFIGGNRMLTSSGDSTCALWDISEGKGRRLQTFSDHSADVMSVSVLPQDKNTFASGSCDSTVKVWDIRANACVRTFTGHVSDVNAVEFFPSGMCVGTGSDDASCRIFDLRSCGPINVLTEEKIIAGVTDVVFSYTGRLMFASYDESFCRAWETVSKDGVWHELKAHKNRVSCLGVNYTGQALCTGSWDTELAIWA